MNEKLFISRDGYEQIPLMNLKFQLRSENDLKNIVSGAVFNRAAEIVQENRVEITFVSYGVLKSIVFTTYENFIEVEHRSGAWNLRCDCSERSVCPHIIASLLYLVKNHDHMMKFGSIPETFEKEKLPERRTYWKTYVNAGKEVEKKDLLLRLQPQNKLAFFLELGEKTWRIHPVIYFKKKDGNFGREIPFTNGNLRQENTEISIGEKILLNLGRDERSNSVLFEYASEYGQLLALLRNSSFFLYRNPEQAIAVSRDKMMIRAEITGCENGYSLNFYVSDAKQFNEPLSADFLILTTNPVILYRKKVLFFTEQYLPSSLTKPLTENPFPLFIPSKELDDFFRDFYSRYHTYIRIDLPEDIHVKRISDLRRKRLYLRESRDALFIELRFAYGEESIEVRDEPFKTLEFKTESGRYYFIERQEQVEHLWEEILRDAGLRRGHRGWYIPPLLDVYEWLFDELPLLQEKGFEIYGEEELKRYKINRSVPGIISSVKTGIDWFDLHIFLDFGGIRVSWKELRKHLRRKKGGKYIRLPDGSIGRLNEELLEKLGLVAGFGLPEGPEDVLRLSKYHTLFIDDFISGSDVGESDRKFRNQVKKLQSFDQIRQLEPSVNFKGKLRAYQAAGLNWLGFLHEYGFGGCLADDMGLGKTVQTLSFLQLIHEGKRRTSLIVVPRSVIFNWEREIARFAPNLSVVRFTGNNRARLKGKLRKYDLVLTTYAILWRDFNTLSSINFYYIVLDESQKIKNPSSLTARSARKMRSKYRLALSGTPIENNTMELWSQFSFLNPGMLGTMERFRKSFALPIEKENSEDTADKLRKLIFPFVLRRTKEEVEKELPDKVENVIYCEMDEKQRLLYNQWRDYYRSYILGEMDARELPQIRMRILEGLTRLRQIAIHPGLVDDRYKKSSGKLEVLMQKIEEVLEEGHKILLYSQFVKMLKIVRQELDAQKTAYCYLDGRTRNRQAQIDLFQNNPDYRVFLISLKAGGLGLNLTAADYVFHLDPWWNPAVEDQASDRAHRIGQKKKVFVYRLITRDSVEEKIQILQKSKKALANELITLDSSVFKKLGKNDIENLFS